jgi:hypothetical protein
MLLAGSIRRSCSVATPSVLMPAMVKKMKQRTEQKKHVGERTEGVGAVLRQQEEERDREEAEQREPRRVSQPGPILRLRARHGSGVRKRRAQTQFPVPGALAKRSSEGIPQDMH